MSAQRVDSLRLVWLQAFLAVAGCRSYTKAAAELGCHQSMVSRYLRELEAWLGKTLFTGYVPAVISKDGKAFLPVATEVVDLLESSRTPEAIAYKRPMSPALQKEVTLNVLRFFNKYGPVLTKGVAREIGLTDEVLLKIRKSYFEMKRDKRPNAINAKDIDMSFFERAPSQETDQEPDGNKD